jgi:hypothetical protein
MEKFLMGGMGYIAAFAAVVVLITVGVMSILLPILVFRILSEMSRMNERMGKIITLLCEAAKRESKAPPSPRQSDDARLGPYVS